MSNVFTPGDLVVSVYGRGAPGDQTTYADNQASPITLEDVSTTGTVGGELVLPQTASGTNNAISGEYGSSSEGSLDLSADGQNLTIAGYGVNAATFNGAEASGGSNLYGNAALAQTTSVPGGSSTAVARVIADVNASGTVDTSTALYNVDNTNNPRSAATVNGSSFYLSGQGVSGDATQGVFYAKDGASSATAIDTSTDTRSVEIYNGQLYVSRDSKQGPTANIASYGGEPTSATTPTVLPGISQSVTLTAAQENSVNSSQVGKATALSPENYFFANATTLYVADSGNPKQNTKSSPNLGDGGLQKWSLVNGSWQLDYTLSAGLNLVSDKTVDPGAGGQATTGLIGLTGVVTGSTVQLYATNATIGDLDQTYLYGITDQLAATTLPSSESFTKLMTAAADTNIRGVAFAPGTFSTTPTITSDTASPASGDLGAGQAVTFTLQGSQALFVSGTPTLSLDDGGTATYAGGSGTTALTFTTTIARGQNAASLAVTGVGLPNGATIQNSVGTAANLGGADATFSGVQVDTTPPVASSVTDTVAQGSGPTPIGLAAPSDNLTPAGSLAIAVSGLPTDGAVTLADGTTPVTAGESLTAAQLTGLEFTPGGTAGQSSAFTYNVTDGAGNTSAGTATLDVGAPGTPPTSTPPASTPSPTPPPVAPDAVSISQQVGYAHGAFTLSGTASSAAGVTSVEISAVVNDGAREDLGTATVNPDGTFTFSDAIGSSSQGFFTATETDGAGGTAQSAGPLISLQVGLGARGQVGQETLYSAGGTAVDAVANYSGYGQRFQDEGATGQTVDLKPYDLVANHHQAANTFVYTPMGDIGSDDVIGGFKLGGSDHDTLALPSSDFRNFAAVLHDTTYSGGSAFITDPNTGDSIQLRGVTEAALKAHPKDFTFG